MNRRLTALFAALEALLVVGVGVGIPLVPLTLMWAVQYGLQLDWLLFWRAAVDVWMIGHGADARFTLDAATAAATGLAGAGETILVTIAPLGFALLTVLLGVRAGRRIGETPHREVGSLVSIGVFGLLALLLALSAVDTAARPSIVQGMLFPTLVFALGVGIGSELSRRRLGRQRTDAGSSRLRAILDSRVPAHISARAAKLGRAAALAASGGAASATLVIAVSALAVAVLIAANYGRIIGLYEGVQSGALGGAALTVAQLALLPNLVIWAASWFVGPGFAIGTGSAISPLGAAVGPLPAVPVLGALPGDLAFGFAGLLVPVVAGFLGGVVLRPRVVRAGLDSTPWLIVVGLLGGLVGGLVLGALAFISGGAAGPGRLAEVGPPWLLVGAWAALEVGAPATIALFVSGIRSRQPQPEPQEPELVST